MRKSDSAKPWKFWSLVSGVYERIMLKDRETYEKMYELMRGRVKGKEVLELATGTGLIALTFTHAGMGRAARAKSRLMRAFGFPLGHAWTPTSYLSFLEANGFSPRKFEVLPSTFPLSYVECAKIDRREAVQ